AALVTLLEGRLAQNVNILSTLAPSSFAGLSLTLLPWLLTGGSLSLHHPFDAEVLACQQRDDRCPTLILPGSVAFRLAEAGAFAGGGQVSVIGVWRGPDELAMSPAWRASQGALIDVPVFGEIGLLAWTPRRRRTPEPNFIRSDRRAARQPGGHRARRTAAYGRRHSLLSRTHGTAAPLPAGLGALRPAAPESRAQRGDRYRLHVPHRFRDTRGHRHRAASRHR